MTILPKYFKTHFIDPLIYSLYTHRFTPYFKDIKIDKNQSLSIFNSDNDHRHGASPFMSSASSSSQNLRPLNTIF